MKQRPILVAVIGYIIGILWGLYFQFSMVLFYILLLATYYIIKKFFKNHRKHKFNLLSLRRYRRYFKLIINKKTIIILIIFSLLSNGIVTYQNKQYENAYQDGENMQFVGIVVSNKIEKQYYDLYQVKLLNSKHFNLYIQVNKKSEKLEYGDKVKIQGEYRRPSKQRNYGGYDDEQYLKTLKIVGRIKVNQIDVIAKKQGNPILYFAKQMNFNLKEKIEKNYNKEKSAILKGLLLGETTDIQEETKEAYQLSNISHVLAISGMHISYIIIGIQWLLKRGLGKRKTKIIIIIFLVFYTFITGFSPSIIRAVTMGIITIIAGLVYQKNDIWNSIAISLFGNLCYNPFLILNVGFQLSYLGTIGIIILLPTILQILEFIKSKKVKEILAVSLSAQVVILPVLLYHFNTIGVYTIVTNFLVSLVIGPIIVMGFSSIMIRIFTIPVGIGIDFLNIIANFSHLPFSKIYIPTPNIISIILYFIGVGLINQIYHIYHLEYLTASHRRVKNLISLFRYEFRKNKKKYVKIMIIILLILTLIKIQPKDFKIYFVDVGQGDCTFMVTPKNKKILIDGGGSSSNEFDVGKKIVIPYLLDRGYTAMDYIIISHFDQDHVRFYPIFITRNESKKCYNRKTI